MLDIDSVESRDILVRGDLPLQHDAREAPRLLWLSTWAGLGCLVGRRASRRRRVGAETADSLAHKTMALRWQASLPSAGTQTELKMNASLEETIKGGDIPLAQDLLSTSALRTEHHTHLCAPSCAHSCTLLFARSDAARRRA